jgi:hypothetical protein
MRCKPVSPVLRWRVWRLWRASPKQLPSWSVAVDVMYVDVSVSPIVFTNRYVFEMRGRTMRRSDCCVTPAPKLLIHTPTLTLFVHHALRFNIKVSHWRPDYYTASIGSEFKIISNRWNRDC